MSSAPITHPHRQRSRDSIDPLLSSANNLTSKNPHQCHKMAPIFFFSPFPFILQIDFGFFFVYNCLRRRITRERGWKGPRFTCGAGDAASAEPVAVNQQRIGRWESDDAAAGGSAASATGSTATGTSSASARRPSGTAGVGTAGARASARSATGAAAGAAAPGAAASSSRAAGACAATAAASGAAVGFGYGVAVRRWRQLWRW